MIEESPSIALNSKLREKMGYAAVTAAKAAGYEDIYKKSLIGITEMEKLMGKKDFQKILGSLVYKPQGKITLVPESDKRPPIQTETAEADFKEDE